MFKRRLRRDYVLFRNVPHSATMRIVERIRLVGQDYMENQVTVVDPEYLTAPWTWTWMYKRWPGYKIQEYVCEDNRYYRVRSSATSGCGSSSARLK
ncbi:MAG TPA: hypothetical protein VF329_14475 [Gammaproteobacteria bacterium]